MSLVEPLRLFHPTAEKAAGYWWDRCACSTTAGVHFGEGAGVDARAVVTRDAEPFTIVAGVPARMIGGRA